MAAVSNNEERINRLKLYAQNLEQRLKGAIPERHKSRVTAWKEMLESDLKKTLTTIESLRK